MTSWRDVLSAVTGSPLLLTGGRQHALANATSMATEHRSLTVRLWLQLGFALGVAVLLRQLLLLFVPFLLGWLIWALALRPWLGLRKVYPRLRPVLFGVASSLAVIVVL